MKVNELWKLVLDDLQVTISPASYSSWIKPLTLHSFTTPSDTLIELIVNCPSSFHQNIVEHRYRPQIMEAIERVTQKKPSITTIINAQNVVPKKDAGPLFTAASSDYDELELAMHRIGLREDFTFDTFAVSSSNEMAHAAAVAVGENFATAYNPLFLYGGVGVGKTHLMQAIAIKTIKKDPKMKMIYCMGEEFTNEIIDAIQQKTTRQFKKRYRELNGLFVDDIQFIAGKTTVQEEFFHTFNAILKAGGQVIMTSDRPPSEIKELEARLRSRFEAGLLVDIGKPDFELRSAITLIKAKQRNLKISMREAQIIAANIESARQIEGFLVRLFTEVQLKGKTIDEPLIGSLLGKSQPTQGLTPPPMRPLEVIKGVAEYFNITSKHLRGAGRSQKLVTPRHIAMYLLRVDYNLPLTEIGEIFSNRDHTTVMHAVEKITKLLKDSSDLRHDLGAVREDLYNY